MQITANSPSSALAIPLGSTGNSSNPAAGETEKPKSKAAPAAATQDATATPSTGDVVSVRKLTAADIAALDKQAANDSNRNSSNGSNLVYAEIWKDGIKVGQVYSDGRVQSNDGSTAPVGPTSAISAQTRAQQLASELGGEVRYPGQETSKADKMRAQLRAAYGV